MAFETISDGLTLVIPTTGTKNWGNTVKVNTWKKISAHNHSGSGSGSKLGGSSIIDNSITTTNLSKNLGATQVTKTVGAAEPTYTIDFDTGIAQVVDLSAGTVDTDIALTLSNAIQGGRYVLKLISNGVFKFSFTTAVIWPNDENPTNGVISVGPIVRSTAEYHLSLKDSTGGAVVGAIDMVELYYDGVSYIANWQTGVGFLP